MNYKNFIIRSSRILLILYSAIFSTLIFASQPNIEEFDNSTLDQQYQLILEWSALANNDTKGQAKSIQKPVVSDPSISGKTNWQPVLGRLAQFRPDDFRLLQPSLALFAQVGIGSDESALFCKNVSLLDKKYYNNFLSSLVQLESHVKDNDQFFAKVLAEKLTSQEAPEFSELQALRQTTLLKPLLFTWLREGRRQQASAAVRMLPELSLNPDEGSQYLTGLISSIETKKDDARVLTIAALLAVQKLDQSHFNLTMEHRQSLHRLAIHPDAIVKQFSAMALLMLTTTPALEDVSAVFTATSGKVSPRGTDVLGAVGFWASPEPNDQLSIKLKKELSTASTISRTGIFSLYSRLKGAPHKFNELKNGSVVVDGTELPLDEFYTAGFFGREFVPPLQPENWKKIWTANPNMLFLRKHVLQSVLSHPKAPDAGWVIQESLAVEDLRDSVLDLLFVIRTSNKELFSEAVKSWLKTVASKSSWEGLTPSLALKSQIDALTAALLLACVCNENRELLDLDARLGALSKGAFSFWSKPVELMIAYDPNNARLNEYRSLLVNGISSHPENAWLIWLLDARRTQKVDTLPLDSLVVALNSEHADVWINGLSSASREVADAIEQHRQPRIFLQSGASPRNTLRLMGVLDRMFVERNSGR